MLDTLFTNPTLWFTIPALGATAVFLLRLLILLIMGDGGHHDSFDIGHTDSGSAAEVFSVQAVLAFFMGLGWGGLGGFVGMKWSFVVSLGVGVGAGVCLLLLFAFMMRGIRRMNASGNIDIGALRGAMDEVVAGVHAKGHGQGEVRLVIADRERRSNAVSAGPELPTRTRVRVIEANSDNTVTVEAV